ncbi:MAG: hypothetical protein ABDH49_04345 [Candidatus Hydrothermales bacterium]
MKGKFKKTKIILLLFMYILFLLFLRGKVLEKSREVYKKEREILELYHRTINAKIEFFNALLNKQVEEKSYAGR